MLRHKCHENFMLCKACEKYWCWEQILLKETNEAILSKTRAPILYTEVRPPLAATLPFQNISAWFKRQKWHPSYRARSQRCSEHGWEHEAALRGKISHYLCTSCHLTWPLLRSVCPEPSCFSPALKMCCKKTCSVEIQALLSLKPEAWTVN